MPDLSIHVKAEVEEGGKLGGSNYMEVWS